MVHRVPALRILVTDGIVMGILLDAVAQLLIYRQVHPGAAVVVGPLLVCVPYAVSRDLVARLTRRLAREGSVSS